MIDSSFPRAWTYGCPCGPAVVRLRLRTGASRRPRSRRYSRYRRSLRPCAAWFAAAQDITELGINDLVPETTLYGPGQSRFARLLEQREERRPDETSRALRGKLLT